MVYIGLMMRCICSCNNSACNTGLCRIWGENIMVPDIVDIPHTSLTCTLLFCWKLVNISTCMICVYLNSVCVCVCVKVNVCECMHVCAYIYKVFLRIHALTRMTTHTHTLPQHTLRHSILINTIYINFILQARQN